MSSTQKLMKVSRDEFKTVTYCDGCGAEAPVLEAGQYVAEGWYRIGLNVNVWDACSAACALGIISGRFAFIASRESSANIFKDAQNVRRGTVVLNK